MQSRGNSSSFDYSETTEAQSFSDDSLLSLLSWTCSPSALTIRNQFFSPSQFATVTESLHRNQSLSQLSITQSNVVKCGFEALCLRLRPTLLQIDLSFNYLTDLEIAVFAKAIVACPKLEKLGLAFNRVTNAGAHALSQSFPSCPQLSVLNLKANRLTASFDISPLVHIQDLNLTGNPLTQQAWEDMFAQLVEKRIKVLRITRAEVTERISGCIAEIVSRNGEEMEVCDLHDVQVFDSLEYLSSLTHCFSFTLSNTSVPTFLYHSMTGLSCLNLSYSTLSFSAFQSFFANSIDVNQSLKFLNLSGNICDMSIANLLKEHLNELSELTTLKLSSMCMSTSVFSTMLSGIRLKKLLNLNLSDNMPASDPTNTVHMSLAHAVLYCDHLKDLNISDNQLESLLIIGNAFASLESLNLERTALKPEEECATIEMLSSCRQLQWLNFSGLRLMCEEQRGFSFRLNTVLLSNCTLVLPAFERILRANLIEIDLSSTKLPPPLSATLFRCLQSSIEILNLTYTSCGDEGCKAFADRAFVFIGLKQLSLGHCNITHVGAELVLGTLGRLRNLRSLDLSRNKIERVSTQSVGFMETSILGMLDFSKNPIPETEQAACEFQAKFPSLIDILF